MSIDIAVSLRLSCIYKLGYALWYMKYRDLEFEWPKSQVSRVEALCIELSNNHNMKGQYASSDYWQDLLNRINNETENMC